MNYFNTLIDCMIKDIHVLTCVSLKIDFIKIRNYIFFIFMLNKTKLILISSLLISAVSCSTWNKLNDAEKGGVIGAGTGAAVGSVVSPGVGGTVVGGAVGAAGGALIGNEMDKDKRRRR